MSKRKGRHKTLLGLGTLILIMVAALVTGCSSGFVPQEKVIPEISLPANGYSPTNGRVQSDSEGAVTIDVEWLGKEGGNLLLKVAMNTHSVDLDTLDLGKLALLRDDAGRKYLPTSWDSQPGGHHRQGTLTFQVPDSKPNYLDLIIRDVAGIKERIFRWELGVS